MAKKIVLIVLGVVLMLCGLGVALPGLALSIVTGSDNAFESGSHSVATPTAALVTQTAQVTDSSTVTRSGFGATTISVTARSSQPVFLGVARSADVDEFLRGVEYDEVRDFDISPYRLDTVRRDGFPVAEAPSSETFWTASAQGTNPTLEWQVEDGDYRVVMMNLDGSPGVQADAQFGITVNGLFGIGIGALLFGAVLAVAGLALLIWGIRTRAAPAPGTAAGGPPPTAPVGGPPGADTQPYPPANQPATPYNPPYPQTGAPPNAPYPPVNPPPSAPPTDAPAPPASTQPGQAGTPYPPPGGSAPPDDGR